MSDVDQSRAFYKMIGFREWLDWSGDQDPNEPTDLPLTGAPTESRIVIMAGKDDYNGMIGLLEFDGPPLEENRVYADQLGIKDVIVMIEVDDVRRIHDSLSATGHTILRPPGDYVSNGPAGRKEGTNMLVRDPDNYVIEITDVTKRN